MYCLVTYISPFNCQSIFKYGYLGQSKIFRFIVLGRLLLLLIRMTDSIIPLDMKGVIVVSLDYKRYWTLLSTEYLGTVLQCGLFMFSFSCHSDDAVFLLLINASVCVYVFVFGWVCGGGQRG